MLSNNHLFDQKHNKMQFIPVMANLNFQHHYSLKCHMILQK